MVSRAKAHRRLNDEQQRVVDACRHRARLVLRPGRQDDDAANAHRPERGLAALGPVLVGHGLGGQRCGGEGVLREAERLIAVVFGVEEHADAARPFLDRDRAAVVDRGQREFHLIVDEAVGERHLECGIGAHGAISRTGL